MKTPLWLQRLFPKRIWKIEGKEKTLYLTFDDGPHPLHTIFILDLLKEYNAKATFFCIGSNVLLYPSVFQRIKDEGHSIGNHTHHHLNGKKTTDKIYITDVLQAAEIINSNLFRPPYGRLKAFQAKVLSQNRHAFKIIMWTVLSGDFDQNISKERCLENVLFNATEGSVVVFHDSDKAVKNLVYALPRVLETFTNKGFVFKSILLPEHA